MKDIKALFEAAKNGGSDFDILSYTDAINECMQTPTDYISNLEYIISSSIGVETFKEFANKYGSSIATHEEVSSIVESCIDKMEKRGIDSSQYQRILESLNEFRKKYVQCFAMYEFYAGEDIQDYTRTYYSFNENGVQNKLLLAGMVKKFGESAIADALITADKMGAVDSVLKYVSENGDQTLCEWVYRCTKDMNCSKELRENVNQKSLSYVIGQMNDRHTAQFRESVLTGDKDATYDYSEEELMSIQNMISFKEYTLTWAEEFGVDPYTEYAEINNLYEEFDGLLLESEDISDEEKKKEDYVPVYGLVKSYSRSMIKNDGTEKNSADKSSAKLAGVLSALTNGDEYHHTCLSFDPSMKEMYSYEEHGFIKDSIDNENWITTSKIYFCVMFLKKSDANNLKNYLKKLEKNPKDSGFAYLNMIRMQIGKPTKANNRFVCSAFVTYCLAQSNPKNLHRDYQRLRPDDITILPRAFYVMTVRDRYEFNAKKDEFKRRVDEIKKNHIEEIEDYNHMLPKIMIQDRMEKLGTLDKFVEWIMNKVYKDTLPEAKKSKKEE